MERFRNNAALLLASNRDNEIIQRFVKINEEICEKEQKSEEEKPLVSIIKKASKELSKQASKLTVTFAKFDEEAQKALKLPEEEDEEHKFDEEGKRRKSSLEDLATPERVPSPVRAEAGIGDDIATKKKRKKKKPSIREEEMYTDKDRAAAAAMGSKDIKHSLKMKKRLDRSRMLQIPEEAKPGNFLALANYEMLRGEVGKALECIKKALELNPNEKNALVARSKCFILLGQPDKALLDAEKALEIDKKFVKALYQKAEALYYLGQFEHSLMYYHRGLKMRPEHEGFQLGVKKTHRAIKNAIGTGMNTTKNKITTKKVKGSDDKTKTNSNLSTPSSIPSSVKKVNDNKETKSKPNSSSKSTIRKVSKANSKADNSGSRVLRELRIDKNYLDKLLKSPALKSPDNSDSAVVSYVQDAVDFLNGRQEFWRQQTPNFTKTNKFL